MSRADLLVAEGWKPKPGARAVVMPSKDNPHPPSGTWRVIDRAPSPSSWWIQPADDRAREWAAKWPNQIVQGCVEAPGRQLVPPGTKW